MKRREFIGLLGGAATWPIAAQAQHRASATIGYLNPGYRAIPRDLTAFRRGLNDTGYAEGRNLLIEFRFAQERLQNLRPFVLDLISRQVDLIFATAAQSAVAAKEATTSIPVVFANGSDPVVTGLVKSLNRPGGNLTGVTFFTGILPGKALEMLHEVVPEARTIGVLAHANSTTREDRVAEISSAAQALGIRLAPVSVRDTNELEMAFSELGQAGINVALLLAEPIFRNRYDVIASLASRFSVAMMTFARDFVAAGALMSYGTDIADGFYQAGLYAGRILNGESPADLPVVQPTRFELVVNLKTAKALGLEIPATLLARADEVIE